MHYNIGSFYPYLWKYFTQTEGHRLLHLNHDPSSFDKIVVTGYPKLDVYLEQESIPSCSIWKGNHDKNGVTKKIIYAPHHSVGKEKLKMSTFEEMHDVMLKIAKKERETQWVYKPHPRLEYSLIKNGLMSKSEYRKYVNAWDNLENAIVYDSGNYFDIFKSSDVLITDCGSFLAEYLPTENPIIWLVSKDSIGFNSVGAELVDCFYKARNTSEFVNVFQSIVNERHDPLKQKRLEAKELLFPVKGKSATAIVDFFESYFGLNNSY
jgi:CDP-glycerol glycerophosphotransferase (TagB/SpsB family)